MDLFTLLLCTFRVRLVLHFCIDIAVPHDPKSDKQLRKRLSE